MKINIILNGKPTTVSTRDSIMTTLINCGYDDLSSLAVAINTTFIPQDEYVSRLLCSGDQVEVVAPMQGG